MHVPRRSRSVSRLRWRRRRAECKVARWLKPDRLVPLAAVLTVVVATALWFVFAAPAWLWHPLGTQICRATYHTAAQIRDCQSYNLHSGIEGNLPLLGILAGLLIHAVAWWRHHNCHHEGCPALGHPHPEHGWPACRGHWDETPSHFA